MKLNFRLVNTSGRAIVLRCLDRPIKLEPFGKRGCECVVGLDEWRFKFRGAAAKFLSPYVDPGHLSIIVETDIPQSVEDAPALAAPAAKPGAGIPLPVADRAQETVSMFGGTPSTVPLGTVDLRDPAVARPADDSGAINAFAASMRTVDLANIGQAKTRPAPSSPAEATAERADAAQRLGMLVKTAAAKAERTVVRDAEPEPEPCSEPKPAAAKPAKRRRPVSAPAAEQSAAEQLTL